MFVPAFDCRWWAAGAIVGIFARLKTGSVKSVHRRICTKKCSAPGFHEMGSVKIVSPRGENSWMDRWFDNINLAFDGKMWKMFSKSESVRMGYLPSNQFLIPTMVGSFSTRKCVDPREFLIRTFYTHFNFPFKLLVGTTNLFSDLRCAAAKCITAVVAMYPVGATQ